MKFYDLAKSRFSVRKFSNRTIEPEKLMAILETGRVAPTGCNYQPQKIYVLKSEEAIAKVTSLSKCIFGAPMVLMVTCDRSLEWKNHLQAGISSGVQDVSIVVTHMMLQAWELGIGSCWVNYFAPDEVKKAFSLPEQEDVILLMPIGYPADDCIPLDMHEKSKSIEEFVRIL